MKHTKYLLTVFAATVLSALAVAPGPSPILQGRQNRLDNIRKAEKELAEYDTKIANVFGTSWVGNFMDSQKTEGELAVDAYKSGKRFTYDWANALNEESRVAIITYITSMETITTEELPVLEAIGYRVHTVAKIREDDLLALYPVTRLEHYKIKYSTLTGTNSFDVEAWQKQIQPSEWLTLLTANYTAEFYSTAQKYLLITATADMINDRAGKNLETDGPEFDAAMQPFVTALAAPLFEGLAEEFEKLGRDVTLPNFEDVTLRANRLAASVSRKTVSQAEAEASLGIVMFVKGVADYNAWAESLKSNNQ